MNKTAILLFLVTTMACSRSQPSQYFILNNSSSAEVGSAEVGSVEVDSVKRISFILGPIFMPQYLRKQEIIEREESHLLRIYDNKLWAEPLKEGIQRLLLSEISNTCGAVGTIHTYSTKKSKNKKHFKLHVESFERNMQTDFVEFSGRYYHDDFKTKAEYFDIKTKCNKENTESVKCMSVAVVELASEFCKQLEGAS